MRSDLYAGLQSALDPRGPQAARIDDLWWIFIVLSVVVWVAVVAVLGLALWRRGRRTFTERPRGEPRRTLVVIAATAVTVVVLLGLVAASALTGRAVSTLPGADRQPVVVTVVGHQWWWEVQYEDDVPGRTFTTANELRIPVGRPVIVHATSRDVIHSFWVPNLHGKRDLVPGMVTHTWIQADRPGVYRGQCAEFCGHQHAHMAFLVIAEPMEEFLTWLRRQRGSAPQPRTAAQKRGHDVFMQGPCIMCHTIRGTAAASRFGPDLTHVAGRRTIAAGTLPTTRGHLAGWIVDSQSIKPGNRMPPNVLSGADLQALLAYIETLK